MRRTILVSSLAVLVVLGCIGGAVYGVRSHQRDRARGMLEVDTAAFETCLLGDAHPAAGTTSATLRGIRLAEGAPALTGAGADGGAPTAGADGGSLVTSWPERCLSYLDPLRASYERAFAAGAAERWIGLDGVRAELAAGSTQHLAEVLDALMPFWIAAAPASVPRPITPLLALLRTSALKAMVVGATELTLAHVEQVQSELHLTLGAPVAGCVLEGSTLRLVCVRPERVATQVLAHAKGGPIVFAQDPLGEESTAVHDGRKVLLSLPSYQYGYAFANGRVVVLTQATDESGGDGYASALYERTPGGQTLHGASHVPFNGTPRSAGGWLLWKEVSEDDPEGDAHIRARDLSTGVAGSALTLGTVGRRPFGVGHSSGNCESTHLFFDLSPAVVIRAPGGKWSVVSQEGRPDEGARTLSCDGDTLRIVDASPTQLRVQECTPAKCTSTTVSFPLPPRAFAAALTTDDVLVVWPSGRAIYALRGKPDDLAASKPFVLVEDDEKAAALSPSLGGPAAAEDAAYLIAMPGRGYVLLAQFGAGESAKTYVVALKKDGTATAIADGK